MTISLADAFDQIEAGPPAPVILIDTCNFLDLFQTDESQTKVPYQPRLPHEEIRDAADLLALVNATPEAAHLIVPELVPREYAAPRRYSSPRRFNAGAASVLPGQTWSMERGELPAPER